MLEESETGKRIDLIEILHRPNIEILHWSKIEIVMYLIGFIYSNFLTQINKNR